MIDAIEFGIGPQFGYIYEVVCDGATAMQFSTLRDLAEYLERHSR